MNSPSPHYSVSWPLQLLFLWERTANCQENSDENLEYTVKRVVCMAHHLLLRTLDLCMYFYVEMCQCSRAAMAVSALELGEYPQAEIKITQNKLTCSPVYRNTWQLPYAESNESIILIEWAQYIFIPALQNFRWMVLLRTQCFPTWCCNLPGQVFPTFFWYATSLRI